MRSGDNIFMYCGAVLRACALWRSARSLVCAETSTSVCGVRATIKLLKGRLMGTKSVGLLWLVVCAMFALPASAHAASPDWKVVTNQQAFEVQAAQVRKDMNGNGKYAGISMKARKSVEADLDKIDALLHKGDSAAKLTDRDQVALMNAQERVNAVLTRNEGNRLICEYRARTGSHLKTKICHTQAQIAATRRNTQRELRDSVSKSVSGPRPQGG